MAVFAFIAMSCGKQKVEIEPLSMTQRDNESKKLRIDGYYLETDSTNDDRLLNVFFLYGNGIVLSLGSFYESTFDEKFFLDTSIMNKQRKLPESWGLYRVSGDSIIVEKWFVSGGYPRYAYLSRGFIRNDSSFVLVKSWRSHASDTILLNDEYHFRKFKPKPDSVTEFIP
jgi:hypothetical protein